MKIGCISWSHRNEFGPNGLDLPKWMAHCKNDAHLDGVELWNNHFKSLDQAYLQQLKDTSAALKLPIYSVATKCVFGSFTSEEIKKAQQTMRDWLDATHFLGVKTMRLSIGGEELRTPEHQKTVFLTLTQVLLEGKYPEITVGIENQEPGVVQNYADVELMQQLSGGRLKLVLDNGSFIDKNDSYEFCRLALPYACVFHAKFFDLNEDGSDRLLDYTRMAKLLKDAKYDGYVSIEYDSDRPATADLPLIADYLRKTLQ